MVTPWIPCANALQPFLWRWWYMLTQNLKLIQDRTCSHKSNLPLPQNEQLNRSPFFFFFWNNTIKSWLKPMFHSEFYSTPFVTMRGDDQGKMVCSLYRKYAEVLWFDAEQQLSKQCNGRRSCSPASQINPNHLFCCKESNWEQRHPYAAERGDVSAGLGCLAHTSCGASFLQGPTLSSVLGLLVSPGGRRWPPRCCMSNVNCLIPRDWQFQLNIL